MISFQEFINESLITLDTPINEAQVYPNNINFNFYPPVQDEMKDYAEVIEWYSNEWYSNEQKKLYVMMNELGNKRTKMTFDIKVKNKWKAEKELLERFKDKLLFLNIHDTQFLYRSHIGEIVKVEIEIICEERKTYQGESFYIVENKKLMMNNGEVVTVYQNANVYDLGDFLNRLNKVKGRTINFTGALLSDITKRSKNKRVKNVLGRLTRQTTVFEKYDIVTFPKIGDCVTINDEYVLNIIYGFDSTLIRIDEIDPLGEEDWGDE